MKASVYRLVTVESECMGFPCCLSTGSTCATASRNHVLHVLRRRGRPARVWRAQRKPLLHRHLLRPQSFAHLRLSSLQTLSEIAFMSAPAAPSSTATLTPPSPTPHVALNMQNGHSANGHLPGSSDRVQIINDEKQFTFVFSLSLHLPAFV